MDSRRDPRRDDRWSRRRFLGGLSVAGTAGLLGAPRHGDGEPPPETTTIRLPDFTSFGCGAPLGVADEFLGMEGFTDVRWVKAGTILRSRQVVASGEADLNAQNVGSYITLIDAGEPVVLLAGTHAGCYELFANDRVRTIRDLKGKSVAVTELGSGQHLFLAMALRYIGLDPEKDVTLVTTSVAESLQLFADKKLEAFMAFATEPMELRARKLGHAIFSTTAERPWSQYFCCMRAGNREFVRKHPVATKRAVRAILKATDLCSLEPARALRLIGDKGYRAQDDAIGLQMLKELTYRWRQHDPDATVRFYALRLHEAGLIKSNPQKILAQGTDWRFLNDLKKELKA